MCFCNNCKHKYNTCICLRTQCKHIIMRVVTLHRDIRAVSLECVGKCVSSQIKIFQQVVGIVHSKVFTPSSGGQLHDLKHKSAKRFKSYYILPCAGTMYALTNLFWQAQVSNNNVFTDANSDFAGYPLPSGWQIMLKLLNDSYIVLKIGRYCFVICQFQIVQLKPKYSYKYTIIHN